MKIFALYILKKEQPPQHTTTVASAMDLSSFGYFQRGSIGEFMTFMAQTIADKTHPGQRQSIEENNYLGHVYARADGIAGVVIADKEYPTRASFGLLNKMLDEFTSKYPDRTRWVAPAGTGANSGLYPELDQYLVSYQDPHQADTIMKVQRELDETKIILHKTIESVLERGEKMESLVERSDVLSNQSKMFYKTAKKQNACCVIC
ncbi:palmitoyltransferase [Dissophora globulifera]|nr:palmitoyltransferase [Dissophora globulifera]